MKCPKCGKEWPDDCEQAVAIEKRGKCIGCIIKDGETFEIDPYEFEPKKTLTL